MLSWSHTTQPMIPYKCFDIRLLTLKAKGCRMFPCTVVDRRMTAVSGQYWYQFTLML